MTLQDTVIHHTRVRDTMVVKTLITELDVKIGLPRFTAVQHSHHNLKQADQ